MAQSPWLGLKKNTYGLGLPELKSQQVTQEDLNMLAMGQQQAPQQQPESFGYTPFLRTPEGQQIAAALEGQRNQAIDAQNQSLKFAQGQLESVLSKKKDIDLLPIAALVDTWSGSNMAPYFQNAKDKNAEIALALQQEILRGRQGLVGSQADMMKDRLGMGADEQKIMASLSKDKYLSDSELKAKRDMQMSGLTSEEERARLNRENALEIAKLNNASRIAAAKTTAGKADKADQFRATDQQYKYTKDIMTSKEADRTKARAEYVQILNEYADAIKDYNPGVLETLTPTVANEKKAKINSIYQNFLDKAKTAAELGALAKQDIPIIEGQVPNLSDFTQSALLSAGGNQKEIAAMNLKRLLSSAQFQQDNDMKRLKESYGKFGGTDSIRSLEDQFNNSLRRLAVPETPAAGNKGASTTPSTREQKIEAIKRLQGGR